MHDIVLRIKFQNRPGIKFHNNRYYVTIVLLNVMTLCVRNSQYIIIMYKQDSCHGQCDYIVVNSGNSHVFQCI